MGGRLKTGAVLIGWLDGWLIACSVRVCGRVCASALLSIAWLAAHPFGVVLSDVQPVGEDAPEDEKKHPRQHPSHGPTCCSSRELSDGAAACWGAALAVEVNVVTFVGWIDRRRMGRVVGAKGPQGGLGVCGARRGLRRRLQRGAHL